MPSILNEALEWLDRAEQAREVAGQLNDPGARKAVLELAESFERLARAAAAPTAARRRSPGRFCRRDRQFGINKRKFRSQANQQETYDPAKEPAARRLDYRG